MDLISSTNLLLLLLMMMMMMKMFLWFLVLLTLLVPGSPKAEAAVSPLILRHRPLLLHLDQEFFLQLRGAHGLSWSAAGSDVLSSSPRSTVAQREEKEATQKTRRSEESPISLDLTFHLLREVLEMARAEQVAQQEVRANRRLMDVFGK